MKAAAERAAVLLEALPYIQRFRGATVVVKYGGNTMVDPALGRGLADDVVLLRAVGLRPVVVHGGGPQINELMTRLGKKPEFRDGLRVTDAESVDIARMVLVGKVNRDIVSAVNVHGPLAVGLSGEDAGLLVASARHADLGYVGDVQSVNPAILHRLLAEDLIPVVSTIGSDLTGQPYNINADTVAGAIAVALAAEKVIFLTDVPGLLADVADPDSLVRSASAAEIQALIDDGRLAGGMLPKVAAALHAVRHGVRSAHFLDGRTPHAVLLELFSDEGVGTMITGGGRETLPPPPPPTSSVPPSAAFISGRSTPPHCPRPTALPWTAAPPTGPSGPSDGATPAEPEARPGTPAAHPPTRLRQEPLPPAPPAPDGTSPLMPTYPEPAVTFVRGEGSWLYDDQGRRYLDCLSGLAVTSLGHAHPAVADALATQAKTLLHVSNLFGNQIGPEVARTLDRLVGDGTPAGGQVFLCNSGAEANECALKLARRFGGRGRHVVVSAYGSFHGRSLATLHATGQPSKHEPFQPLPEGFRHVAWGDLDALAAALDPTVAAVLLEPVQGEGGVNPATTEYFQGVRRLCDERGTLLVVDEVQTGLGRTGRWFGFQHFGVMPDVVTIAKALGNGVPIGACWARADVAAAFTPGDHASTFGGQPLATAAARAVLDVMQQEDVPRRAHRAGRRLAEALSALPAVAGVRGLGLLLGVELDGGDAREVNAMLLRDGLVANAVTPTALRLAPSLLVDDAEIDQAVATIERVL